jgi:hypothetical protein
VTINLVAAYSNKIAKINIIANTSCWQDVRFYVSKVKSMLHGAIFLATCNAILLLRDVKLPNKSIHYTPLMFFEHNIQVDVVFFAFQITVTSKEDVPEFGPSLPNPAVFSKVCTVLCIEHMHVPLLPCNFMVGF